ncbi:MAG: hypothetical protein AAGF55_08345 [Pseudomonadota bacterium]
MKREEYKHLKRLLPREIALPYFEDRESAWLLAQLMPETIPVAAARRAPWGKLLDRSSLRPLMARCGGELRHSDVRALANTDQTLGAVGYGPAGAAAIEMAYAKPWQDFRLTFALWGEHERSWDQTTRQQRNLVIQLGFPSDHAALMGRYLKTGARKRFEWDGHPIRTKGCPTLAWARVDLDLRHGEALIEEVQSDWLRYADDELDELRHTKPRSRELAQLERYKAGLVTQYDRIWPRAMLLATLVVLRDWLHVERVWMHRPETGVVLKRIAGTAPPRSLYSSLPKSFCFAPTRDRPQMLRSLPAKVTKRLPKDGPVFWMMEFDEGSR